MNVRTIELNLSKERFQAWAEWELRSFKGVRDDEEVVISFDPKRLKGDTKTIPVLLDIFKKGEQIAENGT